MEHWIISLHDEVTHPWSVASELDCTCYCLDHNNTLILTAFRRIIVLIVDGVEYHLPNFGAPRKSDSLPIPASTRHIEVHLECKNTTWFGRRVPCGFIASITCCETDPNCDTALTISGGQWRCGATYNDGTTPGGFNDPWSVVPHDETKYPDVPEINLDSDYIWNSDESHWVTDDSFFTNCVYDFTESVWAGRWCSSIKCFVGGDGGYQCCNRYSSTDSDRTRLNSTLGWKHVQA